MNSFHPKMKSPFFPKAIVVAVIAIIGISGFLYFTQTGTSQAVNENLSIQKAVIIDQLNEEIPNQYFLDQTSDYLQSAGYQVDIFTTEDITVDFYKNLPSMNYKIIVIRSHAVGDTDKETPVTLFTGERYTTDKYIMEQLSGQVKRGTPYFEREFNAIVEESGWEQVNNTHRIFTTPAQVVEHNPNDEYFLITPKLVNELMVGQFPGSTIILGGCATLSNPSLAEALINRGASSIVGWDDFVSSKDNDYVMLNVLEATLSSEQKINDAVDSIMENFKPYPKYPATLMYYS